MSYRESLPQLEGGHFLTDGGLETWLVFQRELELPEFAAFHLLRSETGTSVLREYYKHYLDIADGHGAGIVLESPTWRANPRWGRKIGYSEEALDEMNRRGIELMEEIRRLAERSEAGPVVISGCVGPHDDGYDAEEILSATEAETYHSSQVATFADTEADMVTAITMTYADEATGIASAAAAANMPVAISFTVETDGRLPSGQPLADAIQQVDSDTEATPVYFMINCAHPTHFDDVLEDEPWMQRVRGVRANASKRSHAELDKATELDDGDPEDLGARYAELRERHPQITVLGGCCGTDHRHVAAISSACFN